MIDFSREDRVRLIEILQLHEDGLTASVPVILSDISDLDEQLENLLDLGEEQRWLQKMIKVLQLT